MKNDEVTENWPVTEMRQKAKRMGGKTISSVDTLIRRPDPVYAHRSEVIVLHFTDGTSLDIDVGSNAASLKDFKRPGDFSTDFILKWS